MKQCFLFILLLLVSLPGIAAEARILVLGDSLSAAFGIEQNQGWAALLQTRLTQQNYAYRVVNASISGETTAGGLARLPQLLQQQRPKIVILALGANDGLRGLPLAQMKENLDSMASQSIAAGAKVLIVGMQLPPNYGAAYTRLFTATFTSVAKKYNTALAPFLLDGIGAERGLFQQDGLHPTAAAQPRLLDNVWPALERLLEPARP